MKTRIENNFEKNKKIRKRHWMKIIFFVVVAVMASSVCVFSAVAETTYVISDADNVIIHTSSLEDPAQAVAEAGIEVKNTDEIVSNVCEDTGRVNIEIKRAARVLVLHDGRSETAKTYVETVGELLEELCIKTGENRRISHNLSDKVVDGMTVAVETVSCYEKTETEETDFNTMYVFDPSMDVEEEFTIIPGVCGTKEVIYEVTLVDGVEESRKLLSESVLTEPVDALVSTGDRSEATLGDPTEEGKLVATNGSTYNYSKIVPMIATAYTHSGYLTATEVPPRVGIVAADTSVLPFGTLVYITARDGSWTYGYAVVGDTGVKGHILDLFMDSYNDCIHFGARKANVYVIDR